MFILKENAIKAYKAMSWDYTCHNNFKVAKGESVKCEESQKNTQVKCEKATYKVTIYVKIADYIGESEREQDKEKSRHHLQSEVIEELLNTLENSYMDCIHVDMVEVIKLNKE